MHDLNLDKDGQLWIADSKNNRVRAISDPGNAPAGDPNAAPATTTTTAAPAGRRAGVDHDHDGPRRGGAHDHHDGGGR